MKGIVKTFQRTPQMFKSGVGLSKKSNDPEFDEYSRKFESVEKATDKLLKDARVFSENVLALLTAGVGFSQRFATVFTPIAGEFDLIGKNPEAGDTIRNVEGYSTALEELKSTLAPELELIEARVVGPVKEFQGILKHIRKSITKRDHKLVDYDRHNNSLTKLREKKDKTLSDEKNLFKYEQDFEAAANDYDFWNSTMKAELPRFLTLSTQFIDPLFHSFFYMQLNIFYLMMEKLQGFSSGKVNIGVSGQEIINDYEAKRGDITERVEGLSITHRILSTSRMMQQHRQNSGLTVESGPGVSRASSNASSISRGNTSASTTSGYKKAPPPPPSSKPGGFTPRSTAPAPAAPPPYTPPAASVSAMAAATKRAPPPPPGPKPSAKPPINYVVALYDFDAQADGDLSFKTGDQIELLEKTGSSEDWWTGRVNGKKGVFPGNYVQET